jgi:hypothetical protein
VHRDQALGAGGVPLFVLAYAAGGWACPALTLRPLARIRQWPVWWGLGRDEV